MVEERHDPTDREIAKWIADECPAALQWSYLPDVDEREMRLAKAFLDQTACLHQLEAEREQLREVTESAGRAIRSHLREGHNRDGRCRCSDCNVLAEIAAHTKDEG
jgi:hypothetical protein